MCAEKTAARDFKFFLTHGNFLKVVDTLDELKRLYCGDKAIIIAREITKIYEDIKILTIDQWLEYFSRNNNEKQKLPFIYKF